MIADPRAVEGDWLVALDQEEGRGRQGRSWISAAGNFYGSTLVQLEPVTRLRKASRWRRGLP